MCCVCFKSKTFIHPVDFFGTIVVAFNDLTFYCFNVTVDFTFIHHDVFGMFFFRTGISW